MSDGIKIVGLCCSAIICVTSLLIGEMEFAYASGGIFAALLGLPPIGRGISKLVK